jgi:sulfur-oxidizing protein SoxY
MVDRSLSRRRVLAGAAGAGVAAAGWLSPPAFATPDTARQLLQKLAPGESKQGRITIKAPEIAENGNSVPVTIAVDSPMSERDHVKAIHVVADGNPNPGVGSFMLSPINGKAEVQFRVRLAATQNIVVVAEMSDGTSWSSSREIKVTIGGCGG